MFNTEPGQDGAGDAAGHKHTPGRPPVFRAFLGRIDRMSARIRGHGAFRQISANITWLLLDRFIRLSLGLVISASVARHLSPASYGLLAFALSVVTLCNSTVTLGMDGFVLRDLVAFPNRSATILGTALGSRLAGAALSFGLTQLVVTVLRPGDALAYAVVAVVSLLGVGQAFDIIELYFQSRMLAKPTLIARTSAFLLSSVLRIGLIWFGASMIYFAAVVTGEVLLAAGFLVIAYLKDKAHVPLRMWRFSRAQFGQTLSASWPVLFSSLFVLLNMNLDRVLLAQLASDADVGVYSAALRLSEVWYVAPLIFGASIIPWLQKTRESDTAAYWHRARQMLGIMNLTGLAIGIVTLVLAAPMTGLLYGSAFRGTALVLAVHIWTVPFVFHVSIRSRLFVLEDLQRYTMLFSVVSLLINIVLNVLLIPAYGALGCAIASAVSWGGNVLIMPLFFERTRKFSRWFWEPFWSVPARGPGFLS